MLDPDAGATDAARDHATTYGAEITHVYRNALKGYAASMSETVAERVADDPRVVSVIADREVSAPTVQGRPGGDPQSLGQTLPSGIRRINAHTNSTLAGNGHGSVNGDVAVIDTGIDVDHPDLNVVGGYNCAKGSSFDDANGRGTHMAGTIGARDDSIGVVGVAPGVRLWAVRVLNKKGKGSLSALICGVDWVTSMADVIDVAALGVTRPADGLSGSHCASGDVLHQAICLSVQNGVTYTVAAGDDVADAQHFVPPSYDEVITVSALADFNGVAGGGGTSTCIADEDDTLADFSNYGVDVDIAAPGVCIFSTWARGGYEVASGTAMASAHAAGAAALIKASNPTATPAQVKGALLASGSLDWNAVDDPDGFKEVLLDVGLY